MPIDVVRHVVMMGFGPAEDVTTGMAPDLVKLRGVNRAWAAVVTTRARPWLAHVMQERYLLSSSVLHSARCAVVFETGATPETPGDHPRAKAAADMLRQCCASDDDDADVDAVLLAAGIGSPGVLLALAPHDAQPWHASTKRGREDGEEADARSDGDSEEGGHAELPSWLRSDARASRWSRGKRRRHELLRAAIRGGNPAVLDLVAGGPFCLGRADMTQGATAVAVRKGRPAVFERLMRPPFCALGVDPVKYFGALRAAAFHGNVAAIDALAVEGGHTLGPTNRVTTDISTLQAAGRHLCALKRLSEAPFHCLGRDRQGSPATVRFAMEYVLGGAGDAGSADVVEWLASLLEGLPEAARPARLGDAVCDALYRGHAAVARRLTQPPFRTRWLTEKAARRVLTHAAEGAGGERAAEVVDELCASHRRSFAKVDSYSLRSALYAAARTDNAALVARLFKPPFRVKAADVFSCLGTYATSPIVAVASHDALAVLDFLTGPPVSLGRRHACHVFRVAVLSGSARVLDRLARVPFSLRNRDLRRHVYFADLVRCFDANPEAFERLVAPPYNLNDGGADSDSDGTVSDTCDAYVAELRAKERNDRAERVDKEEADAEGARVNGGEASCGLELLRAAVRAGSTALVDRLARPPFSLTHGAVWGTADGAAVLREVEDAPVARRLLQRPYYHGPDGVDPELVAAVMACADGE